MVSNLGNRWLINSIFGNWQMCDKVVKLKRNNTSSNLHKYIIKIFDWHGICENKLNEGMNKQMNDNEIDKPCELLSPITGCAGLTYFNVSSVSLSTNFLGWYRLSSFPRFIRNPSMEPDK